ncbi:MAG: hypothetical protein Tsb0014_31550 [Pleurocapsa sp.]
MLFCGLTKSIKIRYVILSFLSIVLIGIVDYFITVDISFSICYLIPISFVTKYTNKQIGIFLSISSAFSWYIAEVAAKSHLNFLILFWNTLVCLSVFIIIVYLLDTLKYAYEREKTLARIDGLTQIYNRRYFIDTLTIESKRAIRYQRYLTLAYFDVDNFKAINDHFGHGRGDKLLVLIANTVKNTIRETDTIARLGGDEFAILLPEIDYQAAKLVLTRVYQQLTLAVKQQELEVGFSIGAVTFTDLPDSVEQMLERVDKLMYQVKLEGKNQLNHQVG